MAIQSIIQSFKWLIHSPYVWLSGICTGILLITGYLSFQLENRWIDCICVFLMLFLLPFFLAGTYGIISKNESTFALFMKYATHNYFRCLLSLILVLVGGLVIFKFIYYILSVSGLSSFLVFQISFLIFISIILFGYFGDVISVIYQKSVYSSFKDSCSKVFNGSFQFFIFYMVNLFLIFGFMQLLLITVSLILGDHTMSSLVNDSYQNVTDQSVIINKVLELITPSQLLLIRVLMSLFVMILIPILSVYKACFVIDLQKAQQTVQLNDDIDGEYDENGRWYKYK